MLDVMMYEEFIAMGVLVCRQSEHSVLTSTVVKADLVMLRAKVLHVIIV